LLIVDKLYACELRIEGSNHEYNFREAEYDDIQEISKAIILYMIPIFVRYFLLSESMLTLPDVV